MLEQILAVVVALALSVELVMIITIGPQKAAQKTAIAILVVYCCILRLFAGA